MVSIEMDYFVYSLGSDAAAAAAVIIRKRLISS